MLKSWDFKLGSECNTERIISHFDEYPEYEHKRFDVGTGTTDKIFRCYIQRHYDWNAASVLFSKYVMWYNSKVGNCNDVWRSWLDFCHTDYDLTHGYLTYEYLIQVPVVKDLFKNRQLNSSYVSALKLAIYSDLVRYGRFSTVEDVYNIPAVVAFELTKKHFRRYMKKVASKCDNGGHMSYENFRVMKWLYEIYKWPTARRLINSKKIRNRSPSPLVRWKSAKKEKVAVRKVSKAVARMELVNSKVNVDNSSDNVAEGIWKMFSKLEDSNG